jgi:hypothetical protein
MLFISLSRKINFKLYFVMTMIFIMLVFGLVVLTN